MEQLLFLINFCRVQLVLQSIPQFDCVYFLMIRQLLSKGPVSVTKSPLTLPCQEELVGPLMNLSKVFCLVPERVSICSSAWKYIETVAEVLSDCPHLSTLMHHY